MANYKHSKGLSIKTRKRVRKTVQVLTAVFAVVGAGLALVISCWDDSLDLPVPGIIVSILLMLLALFGQWLLTPVPKKEGK